MSPERIQKSKTGKLQQDSLRLLRNIASWLTQGPFSASDLNDPDQLRTLSGLKASKLITRDRITKQIRLTPLGTKTLAEQQVIALRPSRREHAHTTLMNKLFPVTEHARPRKHRTKKST